MTLGVRLGNRVRLSAAGPQAQAALDSLAALIADGLGEGIAEKLLRSSSPMDRSV